MTPKKKKGPLTRLTSLPPNISPSALNAIIKSHYTPTELATNPDPQISITIVPSCYSAAENVALVEFHDGFPAFLKPLGAGESPGVEMEMEVDGEGGGGGGGQGQGRGRVGWFDVGFYGFTQLYGGMEGVDVRAE
jgi:hypothetical protein